MCEEKSLSSIRFSVPDLPKSVNHQYVKTRYNVRLSKEVQKFRELMFYSMGSARNWKPEGVLAGVILFQSPLWITKKFTIREMDCDNRIKPILDSFEQASGIRDERFWNLHAFKVPSKSKKTSVYLFDLGSVIDYHH